DRQNNVITNMGNTTLYDIQDSVNQGKTIAPILWWIYYDPLLTRITKFFKGYILETHTINADQKITKTQTSFVAIAYMNDMLWATHSKEQLSSIINMANLFYQFTKIKVNPSKSILLTKSKDKDKYIMFNREKIPAIEDLCAKTNTRHSYSTTYALLLYQLNHSRFIELS
ncbi:9071_t:CDS:2, partial [Gigaspora rosea]